MMEKLKIQTLILMSLLRRGQDTGALEDVEWARSRRLRLALEVDILVQLAAVLAVVVADDLVDLVVAAVEAAGAVDVTRVDGARVRDPGGLAAALAGIDGALPAAHGGRDSFSLGADQEQGDDG